MTRRTRDERSLRRRTPDRPLSGNIVLIVCEGGKTEPGYFNGLRDTWRLHPTEVEVVGEECGSAPICVVDYALEAKRKRRCEARKGRLLAFDQVWCVFDHEAGHKHPTLEEALVKAKDNGLQVALSVPSFEFWYLLHFVYTTRCFQDAAEVERELRKYIQDYAKSQTPLDSLLAKLETAFKNAQMLREHNERTDSNNPRTDVDRLVKELKSMARRASSPG